MLIKNVHHLDWSLSEKVPLKANTLKLKSDFYHQVMGGQGSGRTNWANKEDRHTATVQASGARKQEHHWEGPGTRPCAQRYECESFRSPWSKGPQLGRRRKGNMDAWLGQGERVSTPPPEMRLCPWSPSCLWILSPLLMFTLGRDICGQQGCVSKSSCKSQFFWR